MMEFITLVFGITVAILAAFGIAFMVMLNPKVMKWYSKYLMKQTVDLLDLEDESK